MQRNIIQQGFCCVSPWSLQEHSLKDSAVLLNEFCVQGWSSRNGSVLFVLRAELNVGSISG